MYGNAELGPAGIGVELVQRPEAENMTGIDRVRIADPGLDLGHRKLARPSGKRRARRDWRARPALFGLVAQRRGAPDLRVRRESALEPDRAQYRVQPQ